MNGIQRKEIHLSDSFQMLPSKRECRGRRLQEKLAIAIHDAFLLVSSMAIESLELQSCLYISKQMYVTTLDRHSIGLQKLRQPWQAIDRDCGEHNAFLQNLLKKSIEDLR